MATRPRLRKLVLTAHIVSSVGWLGAVAVTLALSVVGLTSQDGQVVRGVYLTLEQTGWTVLIPLALASLLTGLIQSLGTKWGLFRHYWIIVKLSINIFALIILLLYTQTLSALADVAAHPTTSDFSALRSPSPALHGGLGMLLLLVAAGLSVYKPRGMTAYGWRKQHQQQNASAGADAAAPASSLT